jgi:hypothetical protein
MVEALDPEFNVKRLERQENFLIDRAVSHDEATGDKKTWHDACAASLIRDAAAIAVLRGDADKAVKLFRESGTRFATLGMFVGFSLLEFSRSGGAVRWRSEHQGIDGRISRAMYPDKEHAHEESAREPFLLASAVSPRQLIHLCHALSAPQEPDKQDLQLRDRVRNMLSPLAELPIGPTGIPLAGYLKLFDEVSQMNSNVARLSSTARDTFLSAILRRREQLNAARADKWHWKMLLNPTDVIDLDLVALGTTIIDRTGSTAVFDDFIGDRGALVAVPLKAAALLRSAQRSSYKQ